MSSTGCDSYLRRTVPGAYCCRNECVRILGNSRCGFDSLIAAVVLRRGCMDPGPSTTRTSSGLLHWDLPRRAEVGIVAAPRASPAVGSGQVDFGVASTGRAHVEFLWPFLRGGAQLRTHSRPPRSQRRSMHQGTSACFCFRGNFMPGRGLALLIEAWGRPIRGRFLQLRGPTGPISANWSGWPSGLACWVPGYSFPRLLPKTH